jgi:hypothetical protein
MSTLTPDQVNYLNIGLMLLAAGLAFWRPYELFLFPLNHLTFIGIGREVGRLLRGETTRAAAPARGRSTERIRRPRRQS